MLSAFWVLLHLSGLHLPVQRERLRLGVPQCCYNHLETKQQGQGNLADTSRRGSLCPDHRLSFIHCDYRTCPCGERCSNRPFAALAQPDMEVFLTEDKGWGVRARQRIPRGTFIVEYAGGRWAACRRPRSRGLWGFGFLFPVRSGQACAERAAMGPMARDGGQLFNRFPFGTWWPAGWPVGWQLQASGRVGQANWTRPLLAHARTTALSPAPVPLRRGG